MDSGFKWHVYRREKKQLDPKTATAEQLFAMMDGQDGPGELIAGFTNRLDALEYVGFMESANRAAGYGDSYTVKPADSGQG